MNESSVRDAILRTEQLSKNYPDGQVQALRERFAIRGRIGAAWSGGQRK